MRGLTAQHFGVKPAMRIVALSCVALLLFIAGAEAVHNHSDGAVPRNSAPCMICVTAHAKAPTLAIHLLPTLHAVESIAVLPETEGKSAISDLRLFIRPPPTV
jgi:hypothetical protein